MSRLNQVARALGVAGAVTLMWTLQSTAQQLPVTPDRVAAVDAQRLYEGACASCHGRLGDGNGPSAAQLGTPRPQDFTAGTYKFRSTPTGSLPTDNDIYRTISRGVPGTWMPPWENLLTPAERWALVQYIKGFSDIFALELPDPEVDVPPEPGVSAELVHEGRFVYTMLECQKCHGAEGRGDGPLSNELVDDRGDRIRPYDFTRRGYKSGSSAQDVYRTLRTGLSGTPMPALERETLAFPGGPQARSPSQDETSDRTDQGLRSYLAIQPTEAQLGAMIEEEKDALVQRRLWALVYYVRSLARPKGMLDWLFRDSLDLQRRSGQ